MPTSSCGLPGPLRRFIIVALLLAGPVGLAEGQSRAGIGRTSLSIPVQMTIRPHLQMSAAAAPQVVGRTADLVEMEFEFTVAANVDWSVTVALPADATPFGSPTVRTEAGEWAPLRSGAEIRVIGRMAPSNGTVVRVRVRLRSSAGARLTDALRFSVGYADGLQGG